MRAIHRIDNPAYTFDLQPCTGRCAATLHVADDVAGRSPVPVQDGQVADVKLGGIAVAASRVIAGALRDGEDAAGVDQVEVLKGHVGGVAVAAAAAVGRVPGVDACPGLDVHAVPHVVDLDVAGGQVLDYFEPVGILADAADGDLRREVSEPNVTIKVDFLMKHVRRDRCRTCSPRSGY